MCFFAIVLPYIVFMSIIFTIFSIVNSMESINLKFIIMLEQNKKQQPSKNEAIDGNIVLADALL